jgi:hypothetical protein
MAKSREERIAAARAKVKKLKEASKQRGRADRMDWRPKALIYLHPDTDIHERRRVWFSKEVDEKDEGKKGKKKGKKGKRIVTVPYNVPDDPECDAFYLLRQVLKDDEGIDGDEVILVVGSGRDKVEYRKGDILNWDDYDYKKRLHPQSDFVCAAVMVEHKGKEVDHPKLETLSGAKTLGKEIVKEIETEVDENGDELGNPFLNPYPFLIEYDETASGTDMYSASARTRKSPNEAVTELLEQDPPDFSDEIEVDDAEAVHAMLTDCLVYDLEIPEPKDAVFKDGTKAEDGDGDQVEDPPKKGEREPEEEPKSAAAQEPAEEVETDRGEEASEDEEDEIAAAERALAEAKAKRAEKAEKAAKAAKSGKSKAKPKKAEKEDKPKTTTRRRKVAKPDPPADDVKVPKDYKDPGPRPDDPNVTWWPDREKGEPYDICPKCEREIPEDATECPHKDCDAEYVVDDGF